VFESSKGGKTAIRTRLNLATAPVENYRRFFVAAAAVGIPALVLCIGLAWTVAGEWRASSQRRVEVARLEKDMAQYRAQRAQLEEFFSSPATRRVTQRAAFLNSLIDQRSFPWTQLFVDLERRMPGGVRIITLAPHLAGDHVEVKMTVGALSDKSKLEFLQALEKAPEFSGLELISESRPNRGEDQDVVKVDLSANYRVAPVSQESLPGGAP
jgi:Tfp pilus assembly protein PilN